MLHVIIQKPFDEAKCDHYTVGDEAIKQLNYPNNPDIIQSVIADGPELDHIMICFASLPWRCNRDQTLPQSMQWFGDDAKFIVANWL